MTAHTLTRADCNQPANTHTHRWGGGFAYETSVKMIKTRRGATEYEVRREFKTKIDT